MIEVTISYLNDGCKTVRYTKEMESQYIVKVLNAMDQAAEDSEDEEETSDSDSFDSNSL